MAATGMQMAAKKLEKAAKNGDVNAVQQHYRDLEN